MSQDIVPLEHAEPEVVFYVWDGERLFLPYPGGRGTGSEASAQAYVDVNPTFRVVKMIPVIDEEECPHDWRPRGFNPDWGTIYECAIGCGAVTP